ncbi:MAG: membrane protein, partial [Lawsonella sp.]
IRQWPTNTTTQGPKNALDRMTSAGGYQTEKLQLEGANEIIYGNLLTLPIGDGGVLYVEPLYAQRKGQESAYPKLIRVMVMYNDRLGYGRSLSAALEQVGLDGSMVDKPEGLETDPEAPALAAPSNGNLSRDEAAAKLSAAIAAVRQAQASGDLGNFGKALEELDKAAQEYQNAAE